MVDEKEITAIWAVIEQIRDALESINTQEDYEISDEINEIEKKLNEYY